MDHVHPQSASRGDDGYLSALGYLQIAAGTLSLTMSLMFIFQALFVHTPLLNPALAFSSTADLLDRAIATYVSLQLTIGWLAGSLQLAAGYYCLKASRPRFVATASFVSLANFPHGTMSAILTLTALRRPEVTEAFVARH
jgi:hypothetical protein